jgi:hypothetical protein
VNSRKQKETKVESEQRYEEKQKDKCVKQFSLEIVARYKKKKTEVQEE